MAMSRSPKNPMLLWSSPRDRSNRSEHAAQVVKIIVHAVGDAVLPPTAEFLEATAAVFVDVVRPLHVPRPFRHCFCIGAFDEPALEATHNLFLRLDGFKPRRQVVSLKCTHLWTPCAD